MPIETLTGSSVNIGGKGDSEKKRQKLESIRGASIVVATAGAFELAMHQVAASRVVAWHSAAVARGIFIDSPVVLFNMKL